jgi:hypothetical protein
MKKEKKKIERSKKMNILLIPVLNNMLLKIQIVRKEKGA